MGKMTKEEAKKMGATHYVKGWFFTKYYKRGKKDQLFQKYVDGVWMPSFICPTKPKPL